MVKSWKKSHYIQHKTVSGESTEVDTVVVSEFIKSIQH